MKKLYPFLLMVLAMAVFACSFPGEIEIRGSASNIKFAASFDFDEMFEKEIKKAFGEKEDGDITLQDCLNVSEIQTYLVCMDAFKTRFDFHTIDGTVPSTIKIGENTYNVTGLGGDIYKLDSEAVLYDSASEGEEPLMLPLASFTEVLNGFTFNPDRIKAKLFVKADNEIAEDVEMEIVFTMLDEDGEEIGGDPFETINASNLARDGSGIDRDETTYAQADLPAGGENIDSFPDMLTEKKDFRINIKVVLPADTPINKEFFTHEVNVSADLVVWLPMDLIADEGAEIEFPNDFFKGVGDFIKSVTDYMESLTLEVGMTANPFQTGTLVMKQESTPLNIQNPLGGGQTLNFAIDANDMRIIEELSDEFKPKILIRFDNGGNIKLPREFGTSYVSLSARLSYTIEL